MVRAWGRRNDSGGGGGGGATIDSETGGIFAGDGENDTTTVTFSNTYRHVGASAGIYHADAGAVVRGFTTDGSGNITGMDVRWDNNDSSNHEVRWNIIGEVA